MSDLLLLLRLDLLNAREHGLDFDDVWWVAIDRRISTVRSPQEREQWRIVFTDTERVWRAAYGGEHVRITRSLTLLRDRDHIDASSPARRRKGVSLPV